MKIGIIGLGWFGKPLAEKLAVKHKVTGTKSTLKGVKDWKSEAITALFLDLNKVLDYKSLAPVFSVDCLVVNIPPSASMASGYSDMMEKILIGIRKHNVKHLIFISSTGVFGHNQQEVDEDSTPEPTTGNGEVLHRAEKYFAKNFVGRFSIIRPGGLIGGDRHPAKYLAGRKKIAGQNHPVNLVHRTDLVALTQFLIENKTARGCFHAVASEHPSKKDYYSITAEKMELDKPTFDESDMSKAKVISGDKTQEETIQFIFNDPYKMIFT